LLYFVFMPKHLLHVAVNVSVAHTLGNVAYIFLGQLYVHFLWLVFSVPNSALLYLCCY